MRPARTRFISGVVALTTGWLCASYAHWWRPRASARRPAPWPTPARWWRRTHRRRRPCRAHQQRAPWLPGDRCFASLNRSRRQRRAQLCVRSVGRRRPRWPCRQVPAESGVAGLAERPRRLPIGRPPVVTTSLLQHLRRRRRRRRCRRDSTIRRRASDLWSWVITTREPRRATRRSARYRSGRCEGVRFVAQHQRRAVYHGTGDRHALALAARHRAGVAHMRPMRPTLRAPDVLAVCCLR